MTSILSRGALAVVAAVSLLACSNTQEQGNFPCTNENQQGVSGDGGGGGAGGEGGGQAITIGVNPCPMIEAVYPCAVMTPTPTGCNVEMIPGCALCTMPSGVPGTSRDGGACCGGCWSGPATCTDQPSDGACGIEGRLCVGCAGADSQCHSDGVCRNFPEP